VDSDVWTAWRNDVFGDPYLVWHDGPDFVRLLKLARSAPADVARMLPLGIAEADPVAASSFGVLAEKGMAPEGAAELLRAAAPTATGEFLIRLAQAMVALTGDQSWVERIASVLASDEFWGVRIDAAMALAYFPPTPKLIEVLTEAARDPNYLVSHHSTNTLRRYRKRKKGGAGAG
jgi:hypothetical protein